MKDMVSITLPLSSSTDTQSESISSNILNSKSGLFILLSNINKKIPYWIKILFRLVFLSILVLKLLGFTNILDIYNNLIYLKLFTYTSCSLVILYQLLNIFLLYKFSNKNVKIPEILPEFLINWLKEFEFICQDPISIKEFKNTCYREIFIYIFIIILITLIF